MELKGSMKIWYIVAAALMVAVCIVCMVLGLTLTGDKYYKLTYEEFEGVTYTSEILSGADVKDGTEVRFSIELDEVKVTGEPIVKTNDKFVLEADDNGQYSFIMKGDTTVKVDNIFAVDSYKVTFDEGEFRTKYKSEQGDTTKGITVRAGDEISFEVIKSVYYVGNYTVLANTTVLEPKNGVYTVAVTENLNITVTGLETDKPFYQRENCGSGTPTNPYKLSRPIDLYSLADLIADGFYTNVMYAYYELTADIDMNGEQLYIIGDATTENSFFAGHFNGNNHKISNFFIEDYIVDQSTFTAVKLPYVGLFGVVSSSIEVDDVAEISNLHIENFKIYSDRTDIVDNGCSIGGIAGYVAGASIIGCSAKGVIDVKGSEKIIEEKVKDEQTGEETVVRAIPFTYVGGLVGIMESASPVGANDFYASIRSCASEIDVTGLGGYVACAGGIVGRLVSSSEKNGAAILNSYSIGDIYGAIFAGGIVGNMSQYCSVLNCYSIGDIYANSMVDIAYRELESFGTACAGGLVGYMGSGGIVANSFMKGSVSASSINPDSSTTKYAMSGDIIGFAVKQNMANLYDYDSDEYNCYANPTSVNKSFYKNDLKWEDSDWVFDGSTYPMINYAASSITYTITVNYVEVGEEGRMKENAHSLTVTDEYLSMGYWGYVTEENGSFLLPEFHVWNGLRSFGYFFDKELKKKVPYSFVPTGDITLYAGFADYSQVAGVYYVFGFEFGNEFSIEFGLDGRLLLRGGAQSYESYYTFDGELVRLYDNALLSTIMAALYDNEFSVATMVAVKVATFGSYALQIHFTSFNEVAILAVEEVDGFAYGEYYDGETRAVFGKNGIVKLVGGEYDGKTLYPYYFSEDMDSIIIGVSEDIEKCPTVTIADGVVTGISGLASNLRIIDGFAGEWELTAPAQVQYVFDGIGAWKFELFDYNNGEKVGVQTIASGSYVIENGVATLKDLNGETYALAEIENGFITVDGKSYAAADSFTGVWIFNSKEPVEINFEGISTMGYGFAIVDYGNAVGTLDATYHVKGGKVQIFVENLMLGELEYSAKDKTLVGKLIVFGEEVEIVTATLCRYDSFNGAWVSNDSTLSLVEFNGLGSYDLNGTDDYLSVKGNIKINGVSVGTYTVANGLLKGEFSFNGENYTLSYDYMYGNIVINEVMLAEMDSLFGTTLIDENGNTYEFDGRGLLDGGGTLTVGGNNEYTYKLGDGVAEISGAQSGNLSLDTYMLTLGDAQAKQLFVNGDFEGSWIIGGTPQYAMTVGKVGANNIAVGTFNDGENSIDMQYNYDPIRKTLSFMLGNAVITVTANKVVENGVTITELSLAFDKETHVCMRSDNTYFDEYKGVYEAEDSKIVLDGFMNSRFGGGTALIFEGEDYASISYQIDDYGHIVFVDEGVTYYIFLESENGKYVCGDKTYDLVVPSKLYRRTIYGLDSQNEIDENVTYTFDGVNGVYDKNGKLVYTYVFKEETEDDKLKLVYRLLLTDEKSGKQYDAVIDYGSTDYTLSMTEIPTKEN